MDDLVDALTFGNVPQVKTALTTVLFALAIYQVAMMSVGYGKVRVRFLKPKAASLAHRSVGDAILPIAVLVGWMCLAYFGVEDGIEHAAYGESTRAFLHVVFGSLLLAVLVLKVVVIRWLTALDRFLPHLGLTALWSLLTAAVITVATIALVTAKIGPGLDSRELRDRQELIEERREAREERLEEQANP